MTKEPCLTCGQPWPETADDIANRIYRHKWVHDWAKKGAGYAVTIPAGTDYPCEMEVEVIAAQYSDEERNHGGDIQAMIVFLIDGVLYRQLGISDSYGSTDWSGPFTKVVPKTKIKWEAA